MPNLYVSEKTVLAIDAVREDMVEEMMMIRSLRLEMSRGDVVRALCEKYLEEEGVDTDAE